jgi:hypothetical protein
MSDIPTDISHDELAGLPARIRPDCREIYAATADP